MKSYLRQLRISPKKVRVVAALVRNKSVSEALITLKFVPKRSAPIIAKLIASAAANAENNFKQKPENLIVTKVLVDEGKTLKRGRPVSRGRWHPILKRTSKVTVELAPVAEKKDSSKKSPDKKISAAKKAEPIEKKKVEKEFEKPVEKKIEVKMDRKEKEEAKNSEKDNAGEEEVENLDVTNGTEQPAEKKAEITEEHSKEK